MPSRLNRCESSWNHPPHEDTTASIPMTIAIRERPGLATGTPFPRLFHSNREMPGWQSGNEIHLNPRIDVPSHDQGDPYTIDGAPVSSVTSVCCHRPPCFSINE